mmetsp:Transcript_15385/g.53644  ORF Transcript_15385/g.53644 Transcript_15385/m.53644 type:complete len:465 (+) Transcript_15385:192-1586(+)
MSAPTLSVCAAALRRAEVLYARRDTNIDAAREAAFALLNDSGGEFDGGALLKQCLVAMSDDPFSALGVEPGAADDAVTKKAYRKLALKYHPDKNDKTTALFQAIKAAYDKLDTQSKRDREAAVRLRRVQSRPAAEKSSIGRRSTGASTRSYASTSDSSRHKANGAQNKARPPNDEGPSRPAYDHNVNAGFHRKMDKSVELQRAEQREADVRRARAVAQARERRRKLLEKMQRDRYVQGQGGRDFLGEKLAAERKLARDRADVLAAEMKRREDVAADAKKHASIFDDLLRGMAKKKDEDLPSPPTGFRASAVGRTDVTLTWDGDVGAQYELQWRRRGEAAWDCADVANCVCRKKNLNAGATYEFRVRKKPSGLSQRPSPWAAHSVVVTTRLPSSASSSDDDEPSPRFHKQSPRPSSKAAVPESSPRDDMSEFESRMRAGARIYQGRPKPGPGPPPPRKPAEDGAW